MLLFAAVGEMAVCTAGGVNHALRKCIQESRIESGHNPDDWINIGKLLLSSFNYKLSL